MDALADRNQGNAPRHPALEKQWLISSDPFCCSCWPASAATRDDSLIHQTAVAIEGMHCEPCAVTVWVGVIAAALRCWIRTAGSQAWLRRDGVCENCGIRLVPLRRIRVNLVGQLADEGLYVATQRPYRPSPADDLLVVQHCLECTHATTALLRWGEVRIEVLCRGTGGMLLHLKRR